jgi:hypothetical protein
MDASKLDTIGYELVTFTFSCFLAKVHSAQTQAITKGTDAKNIM